MNINPYQLYPQMYQPRSNRIYVQGETGAKSYLVAPNSIVDLWDSETQTIYIKSADASGLPSMQILDYTVRGANFQNEPQKEETQVFVNIDEFNTIKKELRDLKELLKPPKRGTKVEAKEGEEK